MDQSSSTAPPSPSPPCVLVVEDDATMRDLVVLALDSADFIAISAGNGLEALARISERRVDVVLVDMVMPEMDGIELIRKLRQKPSCPIIVAMSGGDTISGELYLQVAKRLGVRHTLLKPFGNEELVRTISAALNDQPADSR